MPTKIPVTTLTYAQCAADGQVSVSTIRAWANHPRASLRLETLDLGYRTKRVELHVWQAYKHSRRSQFKHTHLSR